MSTFSGPVQGRLSSEDQEDFLLLSPPFVSLKLRPRPRLSSASWQRGPQSCRPSFERPFVPLRKRGGRASWACMGLWRWCPLLGVPSLASPSPAPGLGAIQGLPCPPLRPGAPPHTDCGQLGQHTSGRSGLGCVDTSADSSQICTIA